MNDPNFVQTVSITASEFNELKQTITKTKSNLGVVIFLLILLTLGMAYLSFTVYRQTTHTEVLDSTNRVLLVSIEHDDDNDLSDSTQVENALHNGGMMRIELEGSYLDKIFGKYTYGRYGATNEEGYYFTLGTTLNYIASRGWNLVQAPTTGLSSYYIFKR